MRFLEKFRRLVAGDRVPAELAEQGVTSEHLNMVRAQVEEAAAKPPRIALLGETGVGKSSTINALFNEGLPISHEKSCTKLETEVTGKVGEPIIIVDLPGVGEDVDADEEHFATYARVLPGVDIALWIIKADNRAMSNIQRALQRLVEDKSLDPKRLVLAINQVDLAQPGAWDEDINQPSVEQERTIDARRKDIISKVQRIVPLAEEHVVAYSAMKFYNLERLAHAMVKACEKRRGWLLFERVACADFDELVRDDDGQEEGS
jgi:predicted GTPase